MKAWAIKRQHDGAFYAGTADKKPQWGSVPACWATSGGAAAGVEALRHRGCRDELAIVKVNGTASPFGVV